MDDNVRELRPSDVEETLEEDVSIEKLREIQEVLQKQNGMLITQLSILGKRFTGQDAMNLAFGVLLDFVFGEAEGEARQRFDTAVAMQINVYLKSTLGSATGLESAE